MLCEDVCLEVLLLAIAGEITTALNVSEQRAGGHVL
jgi:hypothetical protein